MNEDQLHKEVIQLKRNINMLLATHTKLKKIVEQKTIENKKIKELINLRERELKQYQTKYNISKIIEKSVQKEDTAEFKKMLDDYINEIDRCILYLAEA